MLKSCSSRTPNESGDNKCGTDECYLQGSSCTSTCLNPSHYEGKPNGKCDYKDCADRTTNSSVKFPCGDDNCYLDKNAENKCVSDICTYSYIYEPDYNGICVLVDCIERTPNMNNNEDNDEDSDDDYDDYNDNNNGNSNGKFKYNLWKC
jgi:hypothetical protein